MALTSREAYNFVVVQKHDPCLSQIIFTSSICDVYKFDNSSNDWARTNIKGTFFLYSRVSQDGYPYAILVLNRGDNVDFSLGIRPRQLSMGYNEPPIEAALADSIIMVQINPSAVYGLWLFDTPDRQTVLDLIQWCLVNGSTQ